MNNYLTSKEQGEEDRVDLVGVPSEGVVKNISVFKSYLNRKLFMYVFRMNDVKICFEGGWTASKIIESKSDL